MQFKFKYSSYLFIFFIAAALVSMFAVNGCDDAGVENTDPKPNPNVKLFDSLYIEEDSAAGQSFAGINLFDGYNTTSLSPNRDAGLAGGTDPIGINFFLRSGFIDQLLDAGYVTRFYRFYEDITSEQFDTLSVLDAGASLDSLDFTSEDTYGGVWGYFNAPLGSKPVYGFYLLGRKNAGQNNNIPIYGILQPITTGDRVPGSPYGFWMTFKVRMNIAGENDFRKFIPSTE